jgi:hypothetical protein
MENIQHLSEVKHGQVFAFGGETWIGFEDKEMPLEMKGIPRWRFLRADGKSYGKTIHTLEVWERSRESVARVVGYWYDGAENHPSRWVKAAEAETFELLGVTWTRCKNDKMPAALAGLKRGEWEYLTQEGINLGRRGYPYDPADHHAYWDGHNHGIVAYRISPREVSETKSETNPCNEMPEKKPKHKSPSTLRTQAAYAEKMANAAMIKADGEAETPEAKKERLINEMVGNGNIFAPPKRETHPLFRITPMTTTGRVMWGAEHHGE